MSLAITGMQTVTDFFQDLPPGLYDYVLPFLIVFAIIYGLLDELDMFDNDAVTGVLSIGLAFYVTVSTGFGSWMAGFIPSYGLWLVFAIVIAMAFQLGMEDSLLGSDMSKYFAAAVAIGTVYLIYVQGGWNRVFGTLEIPIIGEFDAFSAVILLGAAAAVAWIYSES